MGRYTSTWYIPLSIPLDQCVPETNFTITLFFPLKQKTKTMFGLQGDVVLFRALSENGLETRTQIHRMSCLSDL